LHAGVLLDSGCGEGWYTQMMREVSSEIVALDISKHAVKRAAKRMADTTWLVALAAMTFRYLITVLT
jgi:23S rRNA (guanine745-N1)-methyltransferase